MREFVIKIDGVGYVPQGVNKIVKTTKQPLPLVGGSYSMTSYWYVLKKTDTETVHPSYVASFNRGALYKLVAAYLSGLQNTVEVMICWFSWVTVVMFSLGCHSSLVETQELVQKVVGVQDDTELEIYEQRSLSSIWLSLDEKISKIFLL